MKHAATNGREDDLPIEHPDGVEINGVFFALDLEAIDAEAEADIAAGHEYDHEEVMRWASEYLREPRGHHAAPTATDATR